MTPSTFRPLAESVAFTELEAGRPEAVVSVDSSNDGYADEHINLSILAQNDIALPKGGLTKKTAANVFEKMGFDPKKMYEVNEVYVIGQLGETEGGEVSLFASESNLSVTISVDGQSMTYDDLCAVPSQEREAEFKKNLMDVCAKITTDYKQLLAKVVKLQG